ncbi:MAG: nitronate monooxygenase [Pseudomonadales bacterium]
MESNRFAREFNLEVPIVQGPMGGVAGPELVAAVASAGGLGVLPIWTMTPAQIQRAVAETKRLTAGNFAVNVRADLHQFDHVSAAIESGVSVIHLFWGDPSPYAKVIREANARMVCTVWDEASAAIAVDAGAQALIAQGVEAGGHVLSELPLRDLLDRVLPIAGGIPVVAAGGLATAEDVRDAVGAGASGALLGTRFVATLESIAHDEYKAALIEAGPDATARSECFEIDWPDAPHRHLRNDTYMAWQAAGRPEPGSRPGEGDVILKMGDAEIPRYSVVPPRRGMRGQIRDAVLYAGTGVHRITNIPGAAAVVRDLASLL